MRHAQLVEGIQTVIEALEASGLREALAPELLDAEVLLEALRRYAIAASRFRSAEALVVEHLGLAELDSSVVWSRLLTGAEARAHYHDRIGFVVDHLPHVVDLFEEVRGEIDHESALHVVVVGDETLGIAQRRLMTVVDSLGVLYRCASRVNALAVDELSLVSVECSHDVYLVFDGVAAGISYVKEFLLAAFRCLGLYRDERLEHRIQLIKDALPIGRGIEALRRQGAITSEQAVQLEQDVVVALLAFFDVGALIPEMEADMSRSLRDPSSQQTSASAAPAVAELDALAEEIASLSEGDSEPPRHDSIIVLDDDDGLMLSDGDELDLDEEIEEISADEPAPPSDPGGADLERDDQAAS